MWLVEWCLYRALSKLVVYQSVPYTRANTYAIYDMMADGRENWGRHVVYRLDNWNLWGTGRSSNMVPYKDEGKGNTAAK